VLLLVACGTQDIVLGRDAVDPGRDTATPDAIEPDQAGDDAVPPDDAAADPGASDPGTDPGTDPGIDPGTDPGTDPGPDAEPDTTPAVCIENNDGVIEGSEMPVAIGASPSYVANAAGTLAAVDVDGEPGDDGERVWDFTEGPTAVKAVLFVKEPGGYWFAGHFPDATFVSPLSVQDTSILAAYHATPDGVWLLGIASSVEAPPQGKTLLVYDTPVPLFQFPLQPGATYQATSTFKDARLMGVPQAGTEQYTITVDAVGTVKLPVFTIEHALRLRIEVRQKFVISTSPDPIPSIQYLWVKECLGELARATSQAGETDVHFAEAKEFRRLGL
jgi:hypothetical protein